MNRYMKNHIKFLVLCDYIDLTILRDGMSKISEKLSEKNSTFFECSIYKSDFEKIIDVKSMRKFYNDFLEFSNSNFEKNIICIIENTWFKNNYNIDLFDDFKELLIGNFDNTILLYGLDCDERYKRRLRNFKYNSYLVNSESQRDIMEKILIEYKLTVEKYLI